MQEKTNIEAIAAFICEHIPKETIYTLIEAIESSLRKRPYQLPTHKKTAIVQKHHDDF